MPPLQHQAVLTVWPEHQFIRDLVVNLGSWHSADTARFIRMMGGKPRRRAPNHDWALARQIVFETFDVWDDGVGYYCNRKAIEEVINMARRKAAAAAEDTEDTNGEEETKPRRRRKAASKPATRPTTKVTKRRTKAKPADDLDLDEESEDESEEEAPPKRRRGRKAAPAKPKGNGFEGVYAGKYKPVWDELPNDTKTAVRLNSERNPRGNKQNIAQEFLEGRGRRKTSAKMVIDAVAEEAGCSETQATKDVSHWINTGLLEVV